MDMDSKHERSNNTIQMKVMWKSKIPEFSYTRGKPIDIHILVTPFFKLLLECQLSTLSHCQGDSLTIPKFELTSCNL